MKTLLTISALLILTVSATAQRQISYAYTEIKKGQYNTCARTSYLLKNAQIKKQSGKLSIPIAGRPAKVFKDDNSDENFHEFDYMGEIKGTKLSLVKRTDYNHEEFYLLNRSTGAIDTLIGEPVFAQNMRDFACINNPGTDEEQQVQICEINKGAVNTRVYLKGKADAFLEGIACIKRNFLYAKDNQGSYWKLSFEIGDE
ncbi:hypothetical protein [Flavisolibacter tropicus]|uniref:Uncharacterized protein n=1 Tax=Flavisolibacter tropicus TaxID=1492898 RepID=A0A172TVC0_9BACT|nr:hypothetical protein [Flavisolibacter tropicus]ANE51071.1 hypothetical protein SY85_11725 [Flavisolibacter tropicus]